MRFLPGKAGLGTRERHEKEPDPEHKEPALDAMTHRRDGGSQIVQQASGRELRKRAALGEIEPAKLPEEERASERTAEEPERLSEVHGVKCLFVRADDGNGFGRA